MGKNRQRLKDILVNASGTPEELMPGVPIMELIGDRRILVERHCGICEYTDTLICVRLPQGMLRICGNNLCVTRMLKHQLIVVGKICRLELGQVGQ